VQVLDRLTDGRNALSPAERQVADVVVDDPTIVAFGTVARVAAAAGTSPPTVVRLAHRLGYSGFVELQAAVQADLAGRLFPAADRIRARPVAAPLATTLAHDLENVHATLSAVEVGSFTAAVRVIVRSRRVLVLPADELRGVAATLALQLSALRPGVGLAPGSAVGLGRAVADMDGTACVVALDMKRYERSVADSCRLAAGNGATVVALTDSPLSPLAGCATHSFTVAAAGPGPFDSHVGFLSLLNAVLAGTAAALRSSAADRLATVEAAWSELDPFTS
jgi:DNA-binding MurR/RpiR family transcriptional regulator